MARKIKLVGRREVGSGERSREVGRVRAEGEVGRVRAK